MVKIQDSESNFIKEFEELKLKQKILIESLRNKRVDKYENLLTEIQTKLDFLTKMFTDTESDSSDEEDVLVELKDKVSAISNQVEDVQNSVNVNFKSINSRLSVLEESLDSLKDLRLSSVGKDKNRGFNSESVDVGVDSGVDEKSFESKSGEGGSAGLKKLSADEGASNDEMVKKRKWF